MLKSIYLYSNFFIALAAIVFVYVLSYIWPLLLPVAHFCLFLFLLICIFDLWRLHSVRNDLSVSREVPLKLSLSDGENIYYKLENESKSNVHIEFYDELPEQFQHRDMTVSYTHLTLPTICSV